MKKALKGLKELAVAMLALLVPVIPAFAGSTHHVVQHDHSAHVHTHAHASASVSHQKKELKDKASKTAKAEKALRSKHVASIVSGHKQNNVSTIHHSSSKQAGATKPGKSRSKKRDRKQHEVHAKNHTHQTIRKVAPSIVKKTILTTRTIVAQATPTEKAVSPLTQVSGPVANVSTAVIQTTSVEPKRNFLQSIKHAFTWTDDSRVTDSRVVIKTSVWTTGFTHFGYQDFYWKEIFMKIKRGRKKITVVKHVKCVQDSGYGSPLLNNDPSCRAGIHTNNTIVAGVALPLDVICRQLNIPRHFNKNGKEIFVWSEWQRARDAGVAVRNNTAKAVAHIVDIGPGKDAVRRGHGIDFTERLHRDFGGSDGIVSVQILPDYWKGKPFCFSQTIALNKVHGHSSSQTKIFKTYPARKYQRPGSLFASR